MKLFGGRSPHQKRDRFRPRVKWSSRCSHCSIETTLVDIPPGCRARVTGFLSSLSAEQRTRLQAYGLQPGRGVCVLQRTPIVIVEVEHVELALEDELARGIQVIRSEED